MPPDPNLWLTPRVTVSDPKLRLFAFAHAGASGGVYRSWGKKLAPHVELCPVELPGRWSRIREPLFDRAPALVRALLDGLAPVLDDSLPFAFFGHSLGGLLAFELSRALRARNRALPTDLFVAARRPPQLTPPVTHPPITGLPDAEFVRAMTRYYGGIPQQILDTPDLLAMLVPIMRKDLAMIEAYKYEDEPPLACPIHTLAADADPACSPGDAKGWAVQTSAGPTHTTIPGGHFFVHDKPDAVTAHILRTLETGTLRS